LPARLLAEGVELPPIGRVPRRVFLSTAAIVLCRNIAVLLGLLWTAMALNRLGFARPPIAASIAILFWGGPLIFYALVGMTHAPAFALGALALWLLLGAAPVHRGGMPTSPRDSGRAAWGAGLALGGMVLLRYDSVALLPAACLALRAAPARRATARFLVGFCLPLLALPLWWRLCFGSWLFPPYGGDLHLSFASPWNVLFSQLHGIASFHPALLLALAALAMARQVPWRLPALFWIGGSLLLHGWWSEWANLGGYGQRFVTDALPPLATGFAVLWTTPGVARRAAAIAATAFSIVLFLAAVGGLAAGAGAPWPRRLRDYAPLLRPLPPGELGRTFCRASFLARTALPACRNDDRQ
jgi:hypothetical protein